MDLTLATVLALLGLVGGISAGLLGFGGGVVMFPLLYYVPPLFGLPRFDAQTVAAIAISQVFFSTLVGGFAHRRSGHVNMRIALIAGLVSAGGALAGAMMSNWVSERFLVNLFGVMTLIVGAMMLVPKPDIDEPETAGTIQVQALPLALFSALAGIAVGFLGAGNFVFVPLLVFILKVPIRIAIGSSLFIAMINTSSGFAGKLVTGQIPLGLAAIVVAAAALGALGGERLHGRLSAPLLKRIYAALVCIIAVRIWVTILLG